uniref:N-acetyltransferase domain-containing protein n=1 Tax=Ditylenchus dipsaci TaxID=166011 RepID=A0A915D9V9_9BILA
MEIPVDLSSIFKDSVQRLDSAAVKGMNVKKNPGVQRAIDMVGQLSAEAQSLKKPLTTFDKLLESEDNQAIYLMWKKNEAKTNASIVIGFLKAARRKLYLNDAKGKSFVNTPVCILDFYVHPSFQKQGYAMHEKVEPIQCAFDKPSTLLLEFLKKNYKLENPVWQSTNFVAFPGFFESLTKKEGDHPKANGVHTNSSVFDGSHSELTSPRACEKDSVGGLIHGDQKMDSKVEAAKDSPQGRKNTRDFGHQSIW